MGSKLSIELIATVSNKINRRYLNQEVVKLQSYHTCTRHTGNGSLVGTKLKLKMVQGLGFLSKKSWHTKNKANQEKVWVAEQKKEQELAKASELAREIQQERENDELDRIAGKKSTKDRGIDWMYQQASSCTTEIEKEDAEKKAEQFLLGKEFVGEGAVQGDFHNGDAKEGILSALNETNARGKQQAGRPNINESGDSHLSEKPRKGYEDHTNAHYRNEDFRLRVEDPMYLVSQKQRENKQKHEKMKLLYERVVGTPVGGNSDDHKSAREQKRSTKERNRSNKKKKKKKSSRRSRDYDSNKRHRRRSRSRSDSRSYSRSRSRSRSRSNERHQKRHKDTHDDRTNDRQRRSRSNERHQSEYYDKINRRNEQRGYYDRYDDDDRKRRRNRPHCDQNERKLHSRNRSNNRNYSPSDDERDRYIEGKSGDNAPKQNDKPRKMKGFGLKGATVSQVFDNRDIGPNKDLIRKKKEETERLRLQNKQIGRSRKILTDEERATALRQMQTDARKRENRTIDLQNSSRIEHVEATSRKMGSASFLDSITKCAHGMNGGTLSSRVTQNRHTNQRLHDTFL